MASNSTQLKRGRHRPGPERGSALVEGALVLGLFLTVFLGIADFSYAMFVNQTLTERARHAARTASAKSMTRAQVAAVKRAVQNLVLYGQEAGGAGDGLFGLQPSNVTVDIFEPSAAGAGTVLPARCRITISGLRVPVYTPFYSAHLQNAKISFVMPIEQPITN